MTIDKDILKRYRPIEIKLIRNLDSYWLVYIFEYEYNSKLFASVLSDWASKNLLGCKLKLTLSKKTVTINANNETLYFKLINEDFWIGILEQEGDNYFL